MSRLLSTACVAALLVLTGCATTDSNTESSSSLLGKPKDDPALALQKGMTPAQIEAVMGKPAEKRDVESNGATINVWIYRRSLGSRVEGIAPTMVDVPWVDPITGELKILKEPGASEQRIDFIEELSLYLASGQLAEIRRTVMRERAFSH